MPQNTTNTTYNLKSLTLLKNL